MYIIISNEYTFMLTHLPRGSSLANTQSVYILVFVCIERLLYVLFIYQYLFLYSNLHVEQVTLISRSWKCFFKILFIYMFLIIFIWWLSQKLTRGTHRSSSRVNKLEVPKKKRQKERMKLKNSSIFSLKSN